MDLSSSFSLILYFSIVNQDYIYQTLNCTFFFQTIRRMFSPFLTIRILFSDFLCFCTSTCLQCVFCQLCWGKHFQAYFPVLSLCHQDVFVNIQCSKENLLIFSFLKTILENTMSVVGFSIWNMLTWPSGQSCFVYLEILKYQQ